MFVSIQISHFSIILDVLSFSFLHTKITIYIGGKEVMCDVTWNDPPESTTQYVFYDVKLTYHHPEQRLLHCLEK